MKFKIGDIVKLKKTGGTSNNYGYIKQFQHSNHTYNQFCTQQLIVKEAHSRRTEHQYYLKIYKNENESIAFHENDLELDYSPQQQGIWA